MATKASPSASVRLSMEMPVTRPPRSAAQEGALGPPDQVAPPSGRGMAGLRCGRARSAPGDLPVVERVVRSVPMIW